MNSGWQRNSSLLGVVVVAAAATMTQAAVRAQDSSAAAGDRQVTFTRDVAPILQRSCQTCHRPGMMAPMSLLTYQEARPWARSIKAKVSNREMPPWFIDKHVGIQKYKNDPSLSEAEIQTIVKWVDQGAPQGNAADMPPARNFGDLEAWHIQPTVIVKMPKPYMLKAHGPDEFIDVTIDPGFKEDMYVTAIETRPIHMSAYRVIHHATTNVIEDEDDPTGFFLNGREDLRPMVEKALAPLLEAKAQQNAVDALDGTDNFDFILFGVPNLVANQDPLPYLPEYHGESDTFDKVDVAAAKENEAIDAALLWALANGDARPPQQTRAEVEKLLADQHLVEQMKLFAQWDDWAAHKRGLH